MPLARGGKLLANRVVPCTCNWSRTGPDLSWRLYDACCVKTNIFEIGQFRLRGRGEKSTNVKWGYLVFFSLH